ncbi:hypothetical protein, partial [Vibrio cincinnatiensis]
MPTCSLHISEHSDQSFRDYPITHFRDYPITFSLTPKSVIGIAKTAIGMPEILPFSLLNQSDDEARELGLNAGQRLAWHKKLSLPV